MAVELTGVGLVTSVGHDWANACAALRAGLTRPAPLEVEAADEEGEPIAVSGHPVELATGFAEFGRWVRLSSLAVRDVLKGFSLPAATDGRAWDRTALVVATPVIDADRYLWSLPDLPDALTVGLADPLVRVTGLPIAPDALHALPLGHVGLAEAVRLAASQLAARRADRVLVVTVDSYLEALTLDWLAEASRLKTPDEAAGLMPGEAAGCLLLETTASRRARSGQALAQVFAAPASPPVSDPLLPKAWPQIGRALADAVRQVLAEAGLPLPFKGDVVVDLNGEDWRAHVLGHAQVHLAQVIDFGGSRLRVPADAAPVSPSDSAGVGVGMIAAALARGYAVGRAALVLSVSELGQAAAVLVRAEGTP